MPPAIAVLSGPRLYSSAMPSYSFLTSTPVTGIDDGVLKCAVLQFDDAVRSQVVS